MKSNFDGIYNNKKVFVTGHTGFKGSWLSTWLTKLGATVIGYSLEEPPTIPSNFELSHLKDKITDIRGDVRDYDHLSKTINKYKPDIVFHLAAQPIILRSYEEPKLTFDTNAGGTVNILESLRNNDSVKALVSITTDKVYKNKEWVWGYRETDVLGDTDPYAASKAMAEHAIESYRHSYFSEQGLGERHLAVASTRAGNVVGGGDFADFRLVPDCIKALMSGESIGIRNPLSTRPWQLVFEPLSGYLWLGAKLWQEPSGGFDRAWNFGPKAVHGITVGEIADIIVEKWGSGAWENTGKEEEQKLEKGLLSLDWTSAKAYLGWEPVYDHHETIEEVVDWFKEYQKQKEKNENKIDMFDTCSRHIDEYTKKAKSLKLPWASKK